MPIGDAGGSGGASAGQIKAGGAYFEIVGRDGASKVIAQVQNKLSGFDKSIKKVGSLAGAGGFLGGLLGGSSLTGALMQFGSGLGKELMDAATNAGIMRVELERADKLAASLQKSLQEGFGAIDERINDPSGSKRQGLQDELERLSTEAGGLDNNLKHVRERLKQLAGEDLTSTSWNPLNWLGTPEVDNLKKQLEDLEKRREATGDRMRDKQRELNRENRDIDKRFFERSSKEFFSPNGLSPIASILRPLLQDPEAMRQLRDRTIERDFNLRGTGRTFGGIGSLLTAGMNALGKMGPQLELMTAVKEMRTGFGGQGALGRFGFGQNVAELSLKAQELIARNTVPEKVGKAVAGEIANVFRMR